MSDTVSDNLDAVEHKCMCLQELGDHIDQKGSIVLPDRLRFDFSHSGIVEGPALGRIEALCEKAIGQAMQVHAKEVPLQQAHTIHGKPPLQHQLTAVISSPHAIAGSCLWGGPQTCAGLG